MPLRFRCLRQRTIDNICSQIHPLSISSWGRWTQFDHICSLHSGPPGGDAEGQGKNGLQEHGWEPWPFIPGQTRPSPTQIDDKNIVIGDLNATLEAHRAANRIRKISPRLKVVREPKKSPQDPKSGKGTSKESSRDVKSGKGTSGVWRPLKRIKGRSKNLKVREEKSFASRFLEAVTAGKDVSELKSNRRRRIGEYDGECCWPSQSWKLSDKPGPSHELSPWLTFVDSSALYGTKRFFFFPDESII